MTEIAKVPGTKIPTGAHKPEDAGKELGETQDAKIDVAASAETIANATVGVPAGVVQEDNIGSNDHGQADPRNNERSEFEESRAMSPRTDLDVFLNPAISAAANAPADGQVSFTSHPIANYRVGKKFKFTNGVLTLTKPADIEEFRAILEDLPESERHKIRELNVAAAEKISRKIREEQGTRATKQIDSTTGERAEGPKTGSGRLEDPASLGGLLKS